MRAFLECRNLSEIRIPASVSEIGEEAFCGCDKLTTHAPKGSYAIEFAKENDIKSVEI